MRMTRGRLVVPDSQEEHDFIWREFTVRMQGTAALAEAKLDLWIGCRDVETSVVRLVCYGKKSRFTNWVEKEPTSKGDIECVKMAEKYDEQ